MKKQILFALLMLFIFAACSKQLLREVDVQKPKRNALESATPNLLLSSVIQKSSFLYQGIGGASSKTLAHAVQYMQSNRSSGENIYESFRKPKTDLYSITGEIKLVQAALLDVRQKGLKNHEGIFLIFKSVLWSLATDLYGNIYYTEGLRGQGILFPKFDEQKDIYPELIQNLKDATKLLTEGVDPIDKTYDLYYSGDKTKWIKFANSLRLRLLMR